MTKLQIETDLDAVAKVAAKFSAGVLTEAISANGQASWLLSGGSAPMGTYRLLARDYLIQVDWDNVIVAIGDERCVPLDHPDASWPQIEKALLDVVSLPEANRLRPHSELSAEKAALNYEQMLSGISQDSVKNGAPYFDLVWLGMGEDGHTLSLFPGHPGLTNTEPFVIPVHNSPKPPPDRISLTLKALSNCSHCLVMATGIGKADILAKILGGDSSLPISQAVDAIESSGGQVTWLLDRDAASKLES